MPGTNQIKNISFKLSVWRKFTVSIYLSLWSTLHRLFCFEGFLTRKSESQLLLPITERNVYRCCHVTERKKFPYKVQLKWAKSVKQCNVQKTTLILKALPRSPDKSNTYSISTWSSLHHAMVGIRVSVSKCTLLEPCTLPCTLLER